MVVSRMPQVKELKKENRSLKGMYLNEKLMAKIVAEAIDEKVSAISQAGDGQKNSERKVHAYAIPARRLASASYRIAKNARKEQRAPRWPTGCYV